MVCQSRITEEDCQASFDASTSLWLDEASANRHECCFEKRSEKIVYLRFLRTCRQIDDEARSLCYTSNIFSFDTLRLFTVFVATVDWAPYVRCIHLRIDDSRLYWDFTVGKLDGTWPHPTRQGISSMLPGLQRIHIDLELRSYSFSQRYNQEAEEASLLTQQPLCFAGPALKAATVVISDTHLRIPQHHERVLDKDRLW